MVASEMEAIKSEFRFEKVGVAGVIAGTSNVGVEIEYGNYGRESFEIWIGNDLIVKKKSGAKRKSTKTVGRPGFHG